MPVRKLRLQPTAKRQSRRVTSLTIGRLARKLRLTKTMPHRRQRPNSETHTGDDHPRCGASFNPISRAARDSELQTSEKKSRERASARFGYSSGRKSQPDAQE